MLRCQSLDRSRKSVRYEVIGKSVGGAVHPRLFLENSMDSMEIELKLLARWEADKKRLKMKHIKAQADLDAKWSRTMEGYKTTIKGKPELEELIKI